MTNRMCISENGVYLYVTAELYEKFGAGVRGMVLSYEEVRPDVYEFMIVIDDRPDNSRFRAHNSHDRPFRVEFRQSHNLPHTPTMRPMDIEELEIDRGLIVFSVSREQIESGSRSTRPGRVAGLRKKVVVETPKTIDPYSRLDSVLKKTNNLLDSISKSIEFFIEHTAENGQKTIIDIPKNGEIRIRGRRVREDYFG